MVCFIAENVSGDLAATKKEEAERSSVLQQIHRFVQQAYPGWFCNFMMSVNVYLYFVLFVVCGVGMCLCVRL